MGEVPKDYIRHDTLLIKYKMTERYTILYIDIHVIKLCIKKERHGILDDGFFKNRDKGRQDKDSI